MIEFKTAPVVPQNSNPPSLTLPPSLELRKDKAGRASPF